MGVVSSVILVIFSLLDCTGIAVFSPLSASIFLSQLAVRGLYSLISTGFVTLIVFVYSRVIGVAILTRFLFAFVFFFSSLKEDSLVGIDGVCNFGCIQLAGWY